MPVILKNIIFREKGEVHFPSVALASCIARYTFLQEIDFLNKKYGVKIPHGAGSGVNAFAKKFIEKFGIEEFKKITKRTSRIISKFLMKLLLYSNLSNTSLKYSGISHVNDISFFNIG